MEAFDNQLQKIGIQKINQQETFYVFLKEWNQFLFLWKSIKKMKQIFTLIDLYNGSIR